VSATFLLRKYRKGLADSHGIGMARVALDRKSSGAFDLGQNRSPGI
jgi:hypothetical protein